MDRTDEELITDYLEGDEAAFSALAERHLKSVYSFISRFVGDAREAEDITQETFLKAWKSAKQYNSESSKFKTWILRIARNSAIDFLRKRKHIPFSDFETNDGQNIFAETVADTSELPDEAYATLEDATLLQEIINELSPEARGVLVLHYTNGLTFAQIGEIIGEPSNTVKSRHHRAILNLRKLLQKTPALAPNHTLSSYTN